MSWLSAAGVRSMFLVAVTWTTLPIAHAEQLLSTGEVAASPSRVAHGDLWLLVSSGLLVQRPIVLSLVSFVALAFVVVVRSASAALRTSW